MFLIEFSVCYLEADSGRTKSETTSPELKDENTNAACDDTADVRDIPNHAQYLLIGAGTAAFGAFRAIKSRDPKAKVITINCITISLIRINSTQVNLSMIDF